MSDQESNEARDGDAAVAEPVAEAAPAAETNSTPVEPAPVEVDPLAGLAVKAAELKAAVLRTRLQSM